MHASLYMLYPLSQMFNRYSRKSNIVFLYPTFGDYACARTWNLITLWWLWPQFSDGRTHDPLSLSEYSEDEKEKLQQLVNVIVEAQYKGIDKNYIP